MIQPRPNLGGLPRLGQSHQCGYYRLHGRCLVRRNPVLRLAVRVRVAVITPVNGRQGEFLPVAGPEELYLYFCVHDLNGSLMSTKSAVDSVSMALLVIASKA